MKRRRREIRVAPADAPNEAKADADFVCNGIDDAATLREAHALAVERGCKGVRLEPGHYEIHPSELETLPGPKYPVEYLGGPWDGRTQSMVGPGLPGTVRAYRRNELTFERVYFVYKLKWKRKWFFRRRLVYIYQGTAQVEE